MFSHVSGADRPIMQAVLCYIPTILFIDRKVKKLLPSHETIRGKSAVWDSSRSIPDDPTKLEIFVQKRSRLAKRILRVRFLEG